ncbi:MAG: methyltransferase domain-containing protein [Gemmatimonadales bacterium]
MSAPAGAASRSPHRVRTTCRACDAAALIRFLELGPQPLANSFLSSEEEFADEARYPLDVYLCGRCGLVQLADVIDPEVLFRDYIYVTGTSSTIAAHNERYAETVVKTLGLGGDDLVVEVASNDGSLLHQFRARGTRTLGIEPARNIAALARAKGLETVESFFSDLVAGEVRERFGAARAVVGNNVLAHVDDTQDFLRGAARLLARDGVVITEVPYLEEFVDRLEYDTVYHEHLCYFSVSALMTLHERVGLSVIRVDRVPVHGGSIRTWAALRSERPEHAPEVVSMATAEVAAGLTSRARYETFARDVARQREELRAMLAGLKAEGKRVAAYGAPAKGNTLLNYCGITTELVDYTVDRNPLKVGRFTPGTHLPVRPYDTVAADPPDVLLILAWNFAEEIMRQPQERAFHEAGGRFLIPIPSPRLV